MTERQRLLESIASTVADYRSGEIPPLDVAHIERWVSQFDATVQDPLLGELDLVLKKTYIPKPMVESFLSKLATYEELTGDNPCDFWKSANFLDIQGGGDSQRYLLGMFEQTLRATCGLGIKQCGSPDGPYIYLDDAIFTGNRIKNDMSDWLYSSAQVAARVLVIVIAFHRGGQQYADTSISKVCADAQRKLDIQWWRCFEIEDRLSQINNSDVLRPSYLPNDRLTQDYVDSLRYKPVLRQGTSVGEHSFFTSDESRCLLEQEMLKAGLSIRSRCPYLNQYQRPLGNMVLASLGFGALIVTFRNCPNNAPLAFWAGDPWFPLFPRKTN